jgi:hypothetical protein
MDGACTIDGVRDHCVDGWRHLSWCDVLMAATMSWSTSWRHCSATEGDAPDGGGLFNICHATSNVASMPAAAG